MPIVAVVGVGVGVAVVVVVVVVGGVVCSLHFGLYCCPPMNFFCVGFMQEKIFGLIIVADNHFVAGCLFLWPFLFFWGLNFIFP